jgi:subtilisin family serine protease
VRALRTLALTGALLLSLPAIAAATTSPYVVVYNSTVLSPNTETSTLSKQLGFIPVLQYANALAGFSAQLTATQVSALQANSAVAYVTPDQTFTASGLQALASGETLPVGIRRIVAASTTQVHTASGVGVAVLDTGIDLTNTDLGAVSAINCITSGSSAQDDNGHGTNVAGIIAAKDQGATVVGVAPATKLYSVKVMNKNGSGTLSQILCGINWVTANAAALNIKVANMSFAGSGSNDNNCGNTNNDAEHQAICKLVTAGVTVVAAAGNSATGFASSIPAAYPEVLTVTAMTDTNGIPGGTGAAASCLSGQKDDTYGTYSNYAVSSTDQAHTVAAPGTCIVSDKLGGGTSTYYGTSQAAPAVAGTVALCINDNGVSGPCAGLTPAQVIAKVMSDAKAYATSTNGFTGDPFHPVTGKYFGYLVYTGLY